MLFCKTSQHGIRLVDVGDRHFLRFSFSEPRGERAVEISTEQRDRIQQVIDYIDRLAHPDGKSWRNPPVHFAVRVGGATPFSSDKIELTIADLTHAVGSFKRDNLEVFGANIMNRYFEKGRPLGLLTFEGVKVTHAEVLWALERDHQRERLTRPQPKLSASAPAPDPS